MKTAKLIQLIVWLTIRPFITGFSHFQVVNRSSWRIKDLSTPTILVSNHGSYNDYLFIGSLFPFSSKFLPLRYLVAKGYMSFKTGPLAIILRLGGCIPVGRTNRGQKPLSEVLQNVEQALIKKQIVIIFPEGKRVNGISLAKGGRGTAYLAMKLHVPVVPLYIDCNIPSFWRVLLRKNHVTIYVGKPFYLNGNYNSNTDLLRGTEQVLGEIGSLAP